MWWYTQCDNWHVVTYYYLLLLTHDLGLLLYLQQTQPQLLFYFHFFLTRVFQMSEKKKVYSITYMANTLVSACCRFNRAVSMTSKRVPCISTMCLQQRVNFTTLLLNLNTRRGNWPPSMLWQGHSVHTTGHSVYTIQAWCVYSVYN